MWLYDIKSLAGEEILKYTKVMKDQGVVHIFFRSSPNVRIIYNYRKSGMGT